MRIKAVRPAESDRVLVALSTDNGRRFTTLWAAPVGSHEDLLPYLVRRTVDTSLPVLAGVSLGAASLNWPSVVASSDRSVYFLPLAKPLGLIALLLAVTGAFVLVHRVRDMTRAWVFLGVGWCLSWLLLIRAAAFWISV